MVMDIGILWGLNPKRIKELPRTFITVRNHEHNITDVKDYPGKREKERELMKEMDKTGGKTVADPESKEHENNSNSMIPNSV